MKQTSRLRSGLSAAAILAIAVVAIPAQGQAQRLSLAERVDRLEQEQASGHGGNAVDLVNQIQSLQTEVQQMQGQVEELKHQLDESRQRSKDQYIDLDSRIGRLEGHAPGGAQPERARTRRRRISILVGVAPTMRRHRPERGKFPTAHARMSASSGKTSEAISTRRPKAERQPPTRPESNPLTMLLSPH